MGAVIGGAAAAVSAGLGAVAGMRSSGLGVADALAGDSLHLRASILIFCGGAALVLAMLWARLGCDTPSIARLRVHVRQTLVLCAVTALLFLVTNYAIVMYAFPAALALLPAVGALAIAIRYTVIVHPLSGITGVGLGARLVLRSSCVWLIVAAALQLTWVAVRALGGAPNALWFAERVTIELGLIGFGIPAALGVLQTNLNVVYHSRNMHQALMRWHYVTNGLLVLWGLTEMWAMRFPGSYQSLLAAVLGVGLLIFLSLIASSSGLLERRRPSGGRRPSGDDGQWAVRLAAAAMVLTGVMGGLLAVSATTAAAVGGQPLRELLGAEIATVGLGVVPLSFAAALAAMYGRLSGASGFGAVLIAAGAGVSVVLWSAAGLAGGAMVAAASGAELIAGAGVVLVCAAIMGMADPVE